MANNQNTTPTGGGAGTVGSNGASGGGAAVNTGANGAAENTPETGGGFDFASLLSQLGLGGGSVGSAAASGEGAPVSGASAAPYDAAITAVANAANAAVTQVGTFFNSIRGRRDKQLDQIYESRSLKDFYTMDIKPVQPAAPNNTPIIIAAVVLALVVLLVILKNRNK